MNIINKAENLLALEFDKDCITNVYHTYRGFYLWIYTEEKEKRNPESRVLVAHIKAEDMYQNEMNFENNLEGYQAACKWLDKKRLEIIQSML